MSVQHKIVLVTGAATGIGAAVTRGFAARGAYVFGADVAWGSNDLDGIDRADWDVADEDAVRRWVGGIEDRHGAVDVLVNNAAVAAAVQQQPFERISAEEWSGVMLNNTLAPFLCTRAVVRMMRERGRGRIINLTSSTVFLAVPGVLHYVASKGAVAVMTRALARELGSDGITVNGIAPGLTMTQGMRENSTWTPEVQEAIIAQRCLPREESAEDLVGAALFLADDAAAFITGQILTVDGGLAFH